MYQSNLSVTAMALAFLIRGLRTTLSLQTTRDLLTSNWNIMKKEEIFLSDIKRILFGQAPPEFLLEVFFRTLILYLALLFLVRLLGNRMNAQLSIIEMAVMLTLGAVVAVPMQSPDKGILQGLLILCCTLLFHRGINTLAFRSAKFEAKVLNVGCMIVRDGVLQLDEMKKNNVSHEMVLSQLRQKKVYHLGEVKRLYFEATGSFSLYRNKERKPGLPTFPVDDQQMINIQPSSDGYVACVNCGTVSHQKNGECRNCRAENWMKAIGENERMYETRRN
jgi:uncharacterized membrane protein YcaP (DUF421 family)